MRRWVLVIVLGVLPVACSDDGAEPIVVGEPPASYRITYRVEEGGEESREVLSVRRPFDSRIESEDSVEITTLGRSSRESEDGRRLAVAIPPGVAPGDARVEQLLGSDLLEAGDRKTIAGRDCQVFRTGQSLRLVELIEGDAVEVCIDEAGLVLEERTDGRVRTATDVELDVDDSFDVGDRTIPALNGGGAVQPLTDDSRTPGTFWELGEDLPLPHEGRYAVVPPQPDAFSDATLRGRRVGTTTDILTDGLDVVLVDRGGTLEGVDVLGDDEGAEPVDLGVVGDGTIRHTSFGAEVIVELDGGRFIRVSGTLHADELVAIARGLHEVDGGELTPVGERW